MKLLYPTLALLALSSTALAQTPPPAGPPPMVVVMRAIAPHSSLAWQFPASCLSDVEISLLRPQRAGWMQSERCSLTEHSELYFSADARAYRAQAGGLEALDCLHVPVIRPESRPNGGQPPHIGDKPLPPV